jgi:hypothetical protein
MNDLAGVTTSRPPMWARKTIGDGLFLGSMASISSSSATMRIMNNTLPLDSSRWFSEPAGKISFSLTSNGKGSFNMPLDSLTGSTKNAKIISKLELVRSFETLTIKFCGKIDGLSNTGGLDRDDMFNSPKVAISFYVRMSKAPYTAISTVAKSFVSTTQRCYDPPSMLINLISNQANAVELKDYAELVMDFTPILNEASKPDASGATVKVTEMAASMSYGDLPSGTPIK